jgi:propionyl-CoA synthetase
MYPFTLSDALAVITLRVACADHIQRNAVHGDFDKEVQVPTTIEDIDVVTVAREKVREYFEAKGKDLHKSTETRSKL